MFNSYRTAEDTTVISAYGFHDNLTLLTTKQQHQHQHIDNEYTEA